MADPVNYGYLVAYRARAQAEGQEPDLEVLLVRHPYFNWATGFPSEFPGECMFPGGKFHPSDYVRNQPLLLQTAMRYFRSQLHYSGALIKPSYLPSHEETVYGEFRLSHFFAVHVSHFSDTPDTQRPGFSLPYKWMKPQDALDFALSQGLYESFAKRQLATFQELSLGASSLGTARVTERVVSPATIKILEYLSDHPKLYPIELPE